MTNINIHIEFDHYLSGTNHPRGRGMFNLICTNSEYDGDRDIFFKGDVFAIHSGYWLSMEGEMIRLFIHEKHTIGRDYFNNRKTIPTHDSNH